MTGSRDSSADSVNREPRRERLECSRGAESGERVVNRPLFIAAMPRSGSLCISHDCVTHASLRRIMVPEASVIIGSALGHTDHGKIAANHDVGAYTNVPVLRVLAGRSQHAS